MTKHAVSCTVQSKKTATTSATQELILKVNAPSIINHNQYLLFKFFPFFFAKLLHIYCIVCFRKILYSVSNLLKTVHCNNISLLTKLT